MTSLIPSIKLSSVTTQAVFLLTQVTGDFIAPPNLKNAINANARIGDIVVSLVKSVVNFYIKISPALSFKMILLNLINDNPTIYASVNELYVFA